MKAQARIAWVALSLMYACFSSASLSSGRLFSSSSVHCTRTQRGKSLYCLPFFSWERKHFGNCFFGQFWYCLDVTWSLLLSIVFLMRLTLKKKKQACIVKFNYNNWCIFLCETSHMGYCKFVVMLGERGFGEETIEFLFKFLVLRGCGVV